MRYPQKWRKAYASKDYATFWHEDSSNQASRQTAKVFRWRWTLFVGHPLRRQTLASQVPFWGYGKITLPWKIPQTSLADIRQKRDQAFAMLAQEIDPGVHKKAQKTAGTEETDTFEVIAREWYEKFSPAWAVRHSGKIIRRLELYVFPWLGGKSIKSITAPDLLAVLRRIEAKGTLETAHRTKQNCGQVFRYAVAPRRAERDPPGAWRTTTCQR